MMGWGSWGIGRFEMIAFAALILAAAVALWTCLRQIARLKTAKLLLDERLRLTKDHGEQAIQKLTIAEARFQELHAKIKASRDFVSLTLSAGGVARSITDLGKIHSELTAILSQER